MKYSFGIKNIDISNYAKNWGWILAWGIALVILGGFAMSAAVFTTLVSVIFLGGLFLASGIIMILNTLHFWWRKGLGFPMNLTMGILYVALGTLLITSPIASAISLTFLLALFFMLMGIFRIIYSLILKIPRGGWVLFSGIIALILGLLIMTELPASSLFIIGLFIGIDLMFCGWAFIMTALFLKEEHPQR